MRRYVPLFIAGSAFIAAACQDATAATRSPVATDLPTIAAFGGGAHSFASLVNDVAENNVRGFTLSYPADAVCDPAVSTYGPAEWDQPCITLTDTITVTARFWFDNGIAQSEFSPDIRFNPAKTVTLSTIISAVKGLDDNALTRATFSIGYTRRVDALRYFINDAATDPRLATNIDFTSGRVSRTIQHFSGYFVQWGTIWCEDGSELNDPLCLDLP